MNSSNELQEWIDAQATIETQSYTEVQANMEYNLNRARTATNLAVIVSFLYAITIVVRAVKKTTKIFKRR